MDIKELRALSIEDLHAQLEQARKEMMNLRFQVTMGQLTDTSRLKIARKNIARILTLIQEREAEAAQEGASQ
jgi:large subunit ribosomal protein L29